MLPKEETPLTIVQHANHNYQMFLRDQFATAAMTGILNNGLTITDPSKVENAYEAVARHSYILADAMIKAKEL